MKLQLIQGFFPIQEQQNASYFPQLNGKGNTLGLIIPHCNLFSCVTQNLYLRQSLQIPSEVRGSFSRFINWSYSVQPHSLTEEKIYPIKAFYLYCCRSLFHCSDEGSILLQFWNKGFRGFRYTELQDRGFFFLNEFYF